MWYLSACGREAQNRVSTSFIFFLHPDQMVVVVLVKQALEKTWQRRQPDNTIQGGETGGSLSSISNHYFFENRFTKLSGCNSSFSSFVHLILQWYLDHMVILVLVKHLKYLAEVATRQYKEERQGSLSSITNHCFFVHSPQSLVDKIVVLHMRKACVVCCDSSFYIC